MSKKIRPLYDEHGAEGYYQAFSEEYENPHLPEIQSLIARNFERFDCSGTVLDFAAGGGEVASGLQKLGATNLLGCDPFTHALFERKTGLPCLKLSFKEVIREGLPGQYSLIISSFAYAFCAPSRNCSPLT